jgi:hypothetical protein
VDTDLEESQEVLKFAKQLEIVDKAEAGNLKVHCCAATPPLLRCATAIACTYSAAQSCTHDVLCEGQGLAL